THAVGTGWAEPPIRSLGAVLHKSDAIGSEAGLGNIRREHALGRDPAGALHQSHGSVFRWFGPVENRADPGFGRLSIRMVSTEDQSFDGAVDPLAGQRPAAADGLAMGGGKTARALGRGAGFSAHRRRWLGQYSWPDPPKVTARVRVILPACTNTHPDWRAEVLPTLQLDGELQTGEATFRGVPVSSAQSHFGFSNFVWQLPDFVATRPEGRVEFSYTSD